MGTKGADFFKILSHRKEILYEDFTLKKLAPFVPDLKGDIMNKTDYEKDLHNLKFNAFNCYKRPVIQYDRNGNRLRRYDSITDASNETGIVHNNISRCCNRKGKSAGGFKWLYADI